MILRSVSFRLFALAGMLALVMIVASVDNAMAMYYHPWVRQSSVISQVTYVSVAGAWKYDFTVYNDSYEDGTKAESGPMPVIVAWDIPWFEDANINSISQPTGWAYSIETAGVTHTEIGWDGIADWQSPTDPMYQGATSPFTKVGKVLHWYIDPYVDFDTMISGTSDELPASAIYPVFDPPVGQTSLGIFSFQSGYGETDSPYQSAWMGLNHWTGDPAFPLNVLLPGSPDALGAQEVPEPATMLLLGLGLMGLAGIRRKI